ncbi:MAG: hypothetical protein EBU84_18945 [Actinobacteria bacterium]|nr:hypothetical protein [Actinomycetota bacterium]
MKRTAALLLLAALSVGFIEVPADAAKSPTPGASCSPVGTSRVVRGVKYTCVKSGKKLVWNVARPTSTTAPTTTTTIPADSLDYKGKMIYGIKDAVLTRKADSGTYFETDSRSSSSFSAIRQRAYSELNPSSLSTSHPNIEFVYDIRPSFPASLIDYSKRELDMAAALWNNLFESKVQVRVALLTEQDRQYIKDDSWYEKNLPGIFSRFDGRNERPFISGGGGFWQRNGAWTGNIFLATASYLDLTYVNYEWPQVARHEFFHVVQDYMTYKYGRSRPKPPGEDTELSPLHFREGGANAISYLTSFKTRGWSSDATDWLVWARSTQNQAWMKISNNDDAVRMMVATEEREPNQAFEMSYAIGAVMYEWVIGTYGLDGFTKMLNQFATATNFDQVLQRSLGLTRSEFYSKVAPYVYETFKAANG